MNVARAAATVLAAALAGALALGLGALAPPARAASRQNQAHSQSSSVAARQDQRQSRSALAPARPRAPVGPPLVSSADGSGDLDTTLDEAQPGADASSSAPSSGGDPLAQNGLGSPLCADVGTLSAASRQDCASSGFTATAAPTGDYGLDVHIDTGALGFTAATLEQDYVIGPIWMSLVWVVHALVVGLEWGFSLNLLDGSAINAVERTLRDTQLAFTRPWLVFALALAGVLAAYDGLVRRRVAETLGQAALMLAMIAGGLWVIASPAGTVGALGRWVDEASAGTLAAVVSGTPARAPQTLADGMGDLFDGIVDAPWCYLEFGDVRWCTEPAQLDSRLRTAALRLAAGARAKGGCAAGSAGGLPADSEAVCEALAGEPSAQLAQSATLLTQAQTNGAFFLALPANAAARNSINDSASLLRALCGGSHDATACRGPTAGEAEFRTQSGTGARLGGLLLIALGALGAILLLGFVALRLLGSELLGLVYLLLAPVAVLAPALGDGGRAAFRAWVTRLLGAVASKVLFSFLLGVVLLLSRTLLGLDAVGWWTRWLLVSTLWWGTYLQRNRLLGNALSAGRRVGHVSDRQSHGLRSDGLQSSGRRSRVLHPYRR